MRNHIPAVVLEKKVYFQQFYDFCLELPQKTYVTKRMHYRNNRYVLLKHNSSSQNNFCLLSTFIDFQKVNEFKRYQQWRLISKQIHAESKTKGIIQSKLKKKSFKYHPRNTNIKELKTLVVRTIPKIYAFK